MCDEFIRIKNCGNEIKKKEEMLNTVGLNYSELIEEICMYSKLALYRLTESIKQVQASLNFQISDIQKFFSALQIYVSEIWKPIFERMIFITIADEMGFPVYMEIDTELQDNLVHSYVSNGNSCNREEMAKIIFEYYSDDYVDNVINGICNVQIFKPDRIGLIEEGIEVYKLGYYASSVALFTTQLGGMIDDVYKEMTSFNRLSKTEKEEILVFFNQKCTFDSEKGMLLQTIVGTENNYIWLKIAMYFLNTIYSSKDFYMKEQPMRHKICHGIQTNFNTKEMNLKLIICMDIISELAWRVRKEKEESQYRSVE